MGAVSSRPDFFIDPVVLELIWYRTRANQLIYESKPTGALRKIWTGSFVSGLEATSSMNLESDAQSAKAPVQQTYTYMDTHPIFSYGSCRFAVFYQSFCSRMTADRLMRRDRTKNLVE